MKTLYTAMATAEAGGFALAVELDVNLPGTDHGTAEGRVYQAHAVCPYSNATRGNVPVELTVSEDG